MSVSKWIKIPAVPQNIEQPYDQWFCLVVDVCENQEQALTQVFVYPHSCSIVYSSQKAEAGGHPHNDTYASPAGKVNSDTSLTWINQEETTLSEIEQL